MRTKVLLKMRAVIPLLVLLFSMCGAQTQSTQTEVQTESQSTRPAAVVTTTLDVSTELRALRDTVDQLKTTVVELSVTLTFTQNELQNAKSLLYNMEDENIVVKERLVASETKVEALERVNAAQDTELTTMKTEVMNLIIKNAAQETEMATLKMANAAQETEMATLKMETAAQETRLAASETEVENLKMENAAQESDLTAVKTRLTATETDVVNLEKSITEQPKVAFSAALFNSGYIESGNTDLNLVFTEIITSVGEAYSSTTGFFTARVRGVYYFRFTVMDNHTSQWRHIKLFKNGEKVMHLLDSKSSGHIYLSSGVTLQLEVGDEVNMRLPAGHSLYNDADNHSTFSGFLLFAL